jgi:cytochrome c553
MCNQPGQHIHHLNKNPKDNRDENLILLCKLCHKKEHPNKKYNDVQYKIAELVGCSPGYVYNFLKHRNYKSSTERGRLIRLLVDVVHENDIKKLVETLKNLKKDA